MPCSRRARAAGAPALLALVLGGCGVFGGGAPELPCPRAAVLRDASEVVQFRPGEGRDLTDVEYRAVMPRVRARCAYDRAGIDMEVDLAIVAERGPANSTRTARIPFFAAVVGPERRILAKETFTGEIRFPRNLDRGSVTETVAQRIPLPRPADGPGHTVVVGFQLTPDQLEYNRTEPGVIAPRRRIKPPPEPDIDREEEERPQDPDKQLR